MSIYGVWVIFLGGLRKKRKKVDFSKNGGLWGVLGVTNQKTFLGVDRKGLGEFTGQKIRSKSQKLIEKSLDEFLDFGKNLKNRKSMVVCEGKWL